MSARFSRVNLYRNTGGTISTSMRDSVLDTKDAWIIATDDGNGIGGEVIMVERRGKEDSRIRLGEYLGKHPTTKQSNKCFGMACYAINRRGGSKAPTSGRMGSNASKTGGSTQYHPPSSAPEPIEPGTYSGAEPEPQPEPVPNAHPPTIDHDGLEAMLKTIQQAIRDGDKATYDSLTAQMEAYQKTQPIEINIGRVKGEPAVKLDGTHHLALPRVLRKIAKGIHTYLVGPAGSGKTTLAESLAEALDRTLYTVGAMLTKHEVTGYTDANGNYIPTAAYLAYKHGGILLWDEVDASLPAALVACNALLSNSQYTFPKGRDGEGGTVKRHPDFVVVAAGNTYGTGADRMYVGRLQLDGATLDRFAFVEMGYDVGLENKLALVAFEEHGGTDHELLNRWVAKVHHTRELVKAKHVEHVVSPRASIYGAMLLSDGAEFWDDTVEELLIKGLSLDVQRQLELVA